jgi:hypothetical protein
MKEKDQMQLLIEETGCSQEEAKLALFLSDNNLEKAITTIGFILKFIVVFKIKLIFPKESIYALIQRVINTKIFEILRFSLVFSRNPAIYEISAMNMDWFSFEKLIFSVRLETGTMESYTQEIEEDFKSYIQQSIKKITLASNDKISTIIKNFFHPNVVEVQVLNEEITLSQFRKLPDYNTIQNETHFTGYDLGFVQLDVKILGDSNGKSVKTIKVGDTVLSTIIDERDLAHYLAHLIGGKKNGNMVPIPVKVKKIFLKNDTFEIRLHYTPLIVGITKVKTDVKLKVIEPKNKLWWRKIIPW